MKNYRTFFFFVLPILLLVGYGYYYINSHTFVRVSIHTSHSTKFTILWSNEITNVTSDNINQLSSKSVEIYPHKSSYLVALPRSFDLKNIKSLVINPQTRIHIETTLNQVYFIDQGDTIYQYDVARRFDKDFRILNNSIELVAPKNVNKRMRFKTVQDRGYLVMNTKKLNQIQQNILELNK